MKVLKEVTKTTIFKQLFKSEIETFRDRAKRFQNQFSVQIYLKESLRPNYVYIPINFCWGLRCRTQEKIQWTLLGSDTSNDLFNRSSLQI